MTLLRRFHLNVGQNLFAVGVAEQGTGCPGGSADIPTPLEAFLCDLIPVFLLQPGVGLGSPRSFPIPKIWGSVEQPQLHCVAPPWVVVVWGAAGCGVLWLSGELCWALHIPLPFHLVLTPRGGVGGAGTSGASGSPREGRNLGPPPPLGRAASTCPGVWEGWGAADPRGSSLPPARSRWSCYLHRKLPRGFPTPASQRSLLSALALRKGKIPQTWG